MTTLKIDDLDVVFPFPSAYPEQIEYMQQLKLSLDAGGPCVLEMPSGTGKTVSLMSLIIAYMSQRENVGPLVYCTRTIPEMDQGIQELRRVHNTRLEISNSEFDRNFLGIALTRRSNLCINELNADIQDKNAVDTACRRLTLNYAIEKCSYYENEMLKPRSGVYGISELRMYGMHNGFCPFFLSRRLVREAQVILCSFAYVLDPAASEVIFKNLPPETIVVFDEAHNIDDVCCEFMGIILTENTLNRAVFGINTAQETSAERRASEMEKLQQAYERMRTSMANEMADAQVLDMLKQPQLPKHIMKKALPKSVQDFNVFVKRIRKIIEFFAAFIRGVDKPERILSVAEILSLQTVEASNRQVELYSVGEMCQKITEICGAERDELGLTAFRFAHFLSVNKIIELEKFDGLMEVLNFVSLLGQYDEGFTVFVEDGFKGRTLQLACLDCTLSFQNALNMYKRLVITSGTLSPLTIYPRLLGFDPVALVDFTMSFSRRCLLPMIISTGYMGAPLTSSFKTRNNPAIARAYGELLVRYCEIVPDGIVGFFPSYVYMNEVFQSWTSNGIVERVWRHKLIFIESPNAHESSLALDNYRKAVSSGRGGVFLGVARGRVSEGIDFSDHFGRCVILFGLPVRNTQSVVVQARADFIERKLGISKRDFMLFDAMRAASQCVGRLLRSKKDYGVVVMADKRYQRQEASSQLPHWIREFLLTDSIPIDTDYSVREARDFLRQMAQPFTFDITKLEQPASARMH